MQIGGDYPRPVMVNGYPCRNCDEVSLAKRGVDPAQSAGSASGPAVVYGGALTRPVTEVTPASAAPAAQVDRFA